MSSLPNPSATLARANLFLLFVAGLGGLLYGIDVGIIGGALPYLEATSGLTAAQLSMIVAAVLLGSVISTLFAGLLADWMGRKPLMVLSGLTFVISIPVIALSHGYTPLFAGRLLQGVSGGFIGVVVPLYLAECLPPQNRGKGTGVFQWMLTLGIVAAALMGIYFSYRVQAVARLGDASAILNFKDHAWRSIFWISLPPGALFVAGAFFLRESPRWLFRRGRVTEAKAVLERLRPPDRAAIELREMEETAHDQAAPKKAGGHATDSLLRRKYVIPFVLACVILFCNTATGINSIIGYYTGILLESGLSDLNAHWSYVLFTMVNFIATIIGMTLVDRKGRKFLLILGTSGMILALAAAGISFLKTEATTVNTRDAVQAMVSSDQRLSLQFDAPEAKRLLAGYGDKIESGHASLVVIYSYGGFTAATPAVRSDEGASPAIEIKRDNCVPGNRVEAFFRNPFADLQAAQNAPLHIESARVSQVPDASHGAHVALILYAFMAFYALGPGVCVWLALSELMPTRIRSNGMSIALVINQLVSTTLAGIFLPFVSKHGYSSIFFLFAGFTVVYFITAAFFLPETKGATLEDIEAHFAAKG